MTTLLIAEHDNAHLKDATHKALSAAAQLGGPVQCHSDLPPMRWQRGFILAAAKRYGTN